jgi:alpha-ketoglutarate-dependent taurine dioxygenase
MEVFTSTVYETEHPVVRALPHTGERSLVFGQAPQRIPRNPQHPAKNKVPIVLSSQRSTDLSQITLRSLCVHPNIFR